MDGGSWYSNCLLGHLQAQVCIFLLLFVQETWETRNWSGLRGIWKSVAVLSHEFVLGWLLWHSTSKRSLRIIDLEVPCCHFYTFSCRSKHIHANINQTNTGKGLWFIPMTRACHAHSRQQRSDCWLRWSQDFVAPWYRKTNPACSLLKTAIENQSLRFHTCGWCSGVGHFPLGGCVSELVSESDII